MDPPTDALAGLRLLVDETRWQLVSALRRSDYQVGELVAQTGLAQNLVSYHLTLLRQAGLVSAHRSDADGRASYYSLNLAALGAIHRQLGQALALPTAALPPPELTVAFLCRANSARSQMAEGWLRALGGGRLRACSAGTQPGQLHPLAAQAMAAAGVPIDQQQAKHLDTLIPLRPTVVVTVCDIAREECPVWGQARHQIHWSVADPAAATGDEPARRAIFSRTRDEIRDRVAGLIALLPLLTPQPPKEEPR